MARLRVLVVEDSVTVRMRLCEVLSSDPDMEVVGQACDGKQAIDLCMALRPDVVTMDMMMPVMTGLAATEYIMAHCPTPILIVSASTNRGDLFRTYDALAAGAVDVLDKPEGAEAHGDWERRLLAAVKMTARIRVITHLRARLTPSPPPPRSPKPLQPVPARPTSHQAAQAPSRLASDEAAGVRLLALGASTGGPGAIVEVLRGLPVPLPVPMLVVMHLNDTFASGFADWLDAQTALRVAYAVDGAPLSDLRGRVTLAPAGCHLVVERGLLRLNHAAPRHSCRPAVDCLFESIARECASRTAACLLTGMGRDGAHGLLEIRQGGGRTLVQDEATSVVYGMPREAVRLGAAEQILPLAAIGPALASWINDTKGMDRT